MVSSSIFGLRNAIEMASWSGGNALVTNVVCLRFKSRAGQIKPSVTSGSPPLRHFFERSCATRAQ